MRRRMAGGTRSNRTLASTPARRSLWPHSCHVDVRDLGADMVTDGHAWAFVRYSRDYVDEERESAAVRGRNIPPHLSARMAVARREPHGALEVSSAFMSGVRSERVSRRLPWAGRREGRHPLLVGRPRARLDRSGDVVGIGFVGAGQWWRQRKRPAGFVGEMRPIGNSLAALGRAGGSLLTSFPAGLARQGSHRQVILRNDRPLYQGVALFAVLSIAWPVLEMSWPAPAAVWQAPRSGAIPKNASRIRLESVTLLPIKFTLGSGDRGAPGTSYLANGV